MSSSENLLIRKRKKPTVQLTSLLDLLFIMIFISLIQSKQLPYMVTLDTESTKMETPEVEVKETERPPPEPKPQPVVESITAIFHFYATSQNPDVPTGTYAMEGTFNNDTGELRLGGVSWINRPRGYDMVPLNGEIAPNAAELTGRIEFHGCEQFTLRRTSQISNSHIAGKWEGSYLCTQGETGLTLTIQ